MGTAETPLLSASFSIKVKGFFMPPWGLNIKKYTFRPQHTNGLSLEHFFFFMLENVPLIQNQNILQADTCPFLAGKYQNEQLGCYRCLQQC